MANMEELLAAAGTEDMDDELSYLIDEHLRVIAVPERGVVLGVEGDKNVNRVRFAINRHYHGSDFAKFAIRINYENAEGERNYFTVTDKTVEEDRMSFIWTVDADAVAYKGSVHFVVNCFTTSEDGTVEKAYHTTLGTATVLEGLSVGKDTDSPEIVDLLTRLEHDLGTYAGTLIVQAENAAKNSDESRIAAGNSATAAKTSETNAATSATSAKTSEAAAAKSAAEAKAATGFDPNNYYSKTEADQKFGTPYTLPAATSTALGGVKLSEDFTADADGTLHLAGGTAPDPYPVGIVISMVGDTSPAALFGGTWEEIATNRVLMGASSSHAAGTTAEAGLPNITGSTGRFASAYGPYDKTLADRKQGALSFSGETSDMGYYSSSGMAGYGYYINFNAAKSNAIYGKSNTVQPAAYYVHIWRRIA